MWRPTGNFNTIRESGSVTLLSNGKVLAVGWSSAGAVAELYDPMTGTWSGTGVPNFGLSSGHAVLLRNGKILGVSEGTPWDYGDLPTEVYDPATGQWSTSGALGLFWAPTITPLQNGKVLATGLLGANNPTQADLYDPNTGTWSTTGSLSTGRHYGGYTATLLADGQVLVAGGSEYPSFEPESAEELYDPMTEKWTRTGPLISGRDSHTATLLKNGAVLVAGGRRPGPTCDSLQRSAELYSPSSSSTSNPIDDAQFFIRQQYLDFLEREPEPAGLQFYLDILNGCDPADTECIKYTRGGLSANFFRSPEFGRKGAYIANLFNIVIGQRPKTVAELNDPTKVERPHYGEFMADLATLSTPNDDPVLTNQKKDQLASAWLARSEVQAILPSSLSNQQFVQKLESIAGVTLANESTLIANLNNGSQTRAQVLRAIAESNEIVTKFYIPNFVTMEYLGYLRRDPEDCHLSSDPESCGYIFHNRRFNTPGANPDLIENIIVRGFIESPEYRHRFDGGCAGCWDY
jgi:hypothetical protein